LLAPSGGVPPIVDSAQRLREAVAALASGSGPIAVDTERASGYRYSQRAYLVQLRRAGAGTVLLDPTAVDDLSALAEVLDPAAWVLHAASQDLPCLAELDLRPAALFDTELAGRLAGYERVGLGPLVEQLLGFRLEKGHGAADWSRRPLPADWLTYAALDVELLLPLAEAMAAELDTQGKRGWAEEEFEAVRTAGPPSPRTDPWRRTSGVHRVRKPRQLAAVRELWTVREELARRRDVAPGRVLPDSAVVAAALTDPPDERALVALPVFGGRAQRRQARAWGAALHRARELPPEELPTARPPADGPPPVSRWEERDPAAAARLAAARAALATLAEAHQVPVQNLLQPDLVRRLCWAPPSGDLDALHEALRAAGARRWQRELTAAPLLAALQTRPG
jgi:ribonuclease D